MAESFIKSNSDKKIILVCVGKRGASYFSKRGNTPEKIFTDFHGRYNADKCNAISKYLIDMYRDNEVDEAHLVYTRHASKVYQKPVVEKFLNFEFETDKSSRNILFEPAPQEILEKLIPRYIANKFKLILLETFTAEHSARAMAMKSATDNAKEILEWLVREYNKMRQTNITRSIIEIVSSAEALGR
jgi:F-type H+-transporting ATPase subunit gamma